METVIKKVINCSHIILLCSISLYLNANSKGENFSTQELRMILKNTSEYCDKLHKMVYHCFCIEKIMETIEQSLHYPKNQKHLRNFIKNKAGDEKC